MSRCPVASRHYKCLFLIIYLLNVQEQIHCIRNQVWRKWCTISNKASIKQSKYLSYYIPTFYHDFFFFLSIQLLLFFFLNLFFFMLSSGFLFPQFLYFFSFFFLSSLPFLVLFFVFSFHLSFHALFSFFLFLFRSFLPNFPISFSLFSSLFSYCAFFHVRFSFHPITPHSTILSFFAPCQPTACVDPSTTHWRLSRLTIWRSLVCRCFTFPTCPGSRRSLLSPLEEQPVRESVTITYSQVAHDAADAGAIVCRSTLR